MTYLRKEMTPWLPLENTSLSFIFLYFTHIDLSEVCEMNTSIFFFLWYFKAFLSVFVSLLFTVNSITCEVLTLKRDVKVFGMPVRKMRVEVFDGSGNRYTVTFEGQVTREKALRLLDLIELLGGMPGVNPELGGTSSETSKFEKVRLIVQRRFPIVWFLSKDVQSVYEQEFKEPIGLSTISTYLSRMVDRSVLQKGGMSNRRRYKVLTGASQNALTPLH